VSAPERPRASWKGTVTTRARGRDHHGEVWLSSAVLSPADWFASSGWTPSRSTLLNLLIAAELVLRPLAEYYRRWALSSGAMGCDETTVTLIVPTVLPEMAAHDPRSRRIHDVLKRALEEGRPSVTARMWAYRSFERPVNVFDFTVSRHRDGPDESQNTRACCWATAGRVFKRSNCAARRGSCVPPAGRMPGGRCSRDAPATRIRPAYSWR
jgi:hypothetical protein